MPTEILKKFRARFAAQTSSALTAGQFPEDGSYTADANCVTLDANIAASENCKGADIVTLELDVTTGPATAATANIYYRGSNDGGTTWTKWKYSHAVGGSLIAGVADLHDAGVFVLSHKLTQLAVAAVSFGFTSVLYATAIIPGEAQ